MAKWHYSLIGVRVDPKKLKVPEWKKEFEHDYPADYQFDPFNGKKLWKSVMVPIEGYNEKAQTLGQFSIFIDHDKNVGFVTACWTGFEEYKTVCSMATMPDDLDIGAIRRDLKEYLEPMGLWEEKEFGFWCCCLNDYVAQNYHHQNYT